MATDETGQGARRTMRWLDIIAWLGVVSAALLAYCSARPWARVVVSGSVGQNGPNMSGSYAETVGMALGAFLARPGTDSFARWEDVTFLWLITVASGVVLGLTTAIWRRSRLAATAYLVWLVATTASIVGATALVFGSSPRSWCQFNCGAVTDIARTPLPMFWLALGALGVSWLGGGARLAELRLAAERGNAFSWRDVARSLAQPTRVSAVIFSAGLFVWFFGYIFTPWATQGCTGYPVNWYYFTNGSCSGADSDAALVHTVLPAVGVHNDFTSVGALEFYILFGMLLALIAVWQRGWGPTVVTLLWATSATWLTSVAISGIPALLANPPRFAYSAPTTPWVAGYGPVVSVVGLAIVWVGTGLLAWRSALAWRARTARQRPEPVVPA